MSYKEDPRDAALRKLSFRARTEKEIRDFLAEKEFTEEEIEDTVSFLKEYDYLNDERYCRQYYIYSRSKGKALYRIIQELKQKGISSSVSKNVIDDMENDAEYEGKLVDDREAALKVGLKMTRAQKNENKPIDEKFLAKVGRRLMSLGYSSGTCYFVIGKIRNYEKD